MAPGPEEQDSFLLQRKCGPALRPNWRPSYDILARTTDDSEQGSPCSRRTPGEWYELLLLFAISPVHGIVRTPQQRLCQSPEVTE